MDFCKHCGNKLEVDANFCSSCGKEVMRPEEEFTENKNLDPESQSTFDEEPRDLSNQEKVFFFIGENHHYFLKKWQQKSSWNWAGFFLTFYWLGYRKLYIPLFITIGIYVAVATLLFLLLPVELYFINSLIGFVLCFYVGMKGNTLYKNQLNRKLAELDTIPSSKQEKVELIRRAGGTSIGGVFTALGIIMAWGVIVASILIKPYIHEFFPTTEVVFGTGTYEYGIEEEKDTFTSDETIIMDVYLDEPIGIDEIHYVISKKGENGEYYPYDNWYAEIDPTWDYFFTDITNDYEGFNGFLKGEYILEVMNESEVLAEGSFTVNSKMPYYVAFGTGTFEYGIEELKDTFTTDDTIIMDVYLDEPVGVHEVQFVIFKKEENGVYRTYDSWYDELDPAWDTFFTEITYDYGGFTRFHEGEYIIKVKYKSEVLAEGSLTVEE